MSPRPLGQHFLIRRSVESRILQALELCPQDKVLEIGPGKGALTGLLVQRVQKLLLIEKDPALAAEMEAILKSSGKVEVRSEDFLKTSWELIEASLGKKFKVVSNLPYQAATAILTKLLKHQAPGSIMVLMFQKEVAERLLAKPHSKDYGTLTVYARLFCQMKRVMEVPPTAFRPPPEVWSTVLKFRFLEKPLLEPAEIPKFEKLLRAGFIHRRKMLRQNLKAYFSGKSSGQLEEMLGSLGASPGARAEELSCDQWLDLFHQGST